MSNQMDMTKKYISSEVRFYTVSDVMKMTGWSEAIVLRVFNDPTFPCADYGKSKVIEAHALIDYFSRRHEKGSERYWKKGDLRDDLRRRAR